jgi:hypothetical protein
MDPSSGAPLPIGRERLMVIGVEKAARDAIETTFCHLQQKSLDGPSRASAPGVPTGNLIRLASSRESGDVRP